MKPRSRRSRPLAICIAAAALVACLIAPTAQAASPAWQPVAVSGPTNLPPVQSEVQRLAVNAEGGTYTLSGTTAKGEGTLDFVAGMGAYGSGATSIEVCFPSGNFTEGQTVEGPGIAAGTTIVAPPTTTANCAGFGLPGVVLTISAPTSGGTFGDTVTARSKVVSGVSASLGSFAAGQGIAGTGIPAGTTITAVGTGTLTLSNFPTQGGTPDLTATETTGPIAFDATATELEAELNSQPTLDVMVNGGPGGPNGGAPYFISFGGALANADVAELSADDTSLTGSNPWVNVLTTVPGGPGTAEIAIYAQNIGGEASSSATTSLAASLPADVVLTGPPKVEPGAGEEPWSCSGAAGDNSFTCTRTEPVPPGTVAGVINAPVVSEPDAAGGSVDVTVSGGGAAAPASYSMPLTVSPNPAEPGIQAFTAGAYDEDGVPDQRAGAHPYSASTAIFVNTHRNHFGFVIPVGEPKDIVVDLPPGFIGNPTATPQCPESNIGAIADKDFCPRNTIVGRAGPVIKGFGSAGGNVSVYNVEAPLGAPGKFFFLVGDVPIHAVGGLRSDEDYGITVGSFSTPQLATVYGSFFTFWGTPADESHDNQRCGTFGEPVCPAPEPFGEGAHNALLSNPTDCALEAAEPPVAKLRLSTWQDPSKTHTAEVGLPPVTGCENLKFEAGFGFEPSTGASDSPASFQSEVTVPSEGLLDPDKLMTPPIREAVVELPKGVVLNASAADGLGACSEQQIGLRGTNFPEPNRIRFTKDPNTCPASSKIGNAELKSALLENPLHGDLFLAAQGEGNPFGSLFALYLVIEDPRHGIFVKLPGEVKVDESDGQQRVVFRDLPQLPFSWLKLKLKGGDRSPLATPTTCGNYTTTMTNTPWSAPESGPPLTSRSSFQVDSGPNGSACANTPAERPFGLGLRAGSVIPLAGAKSPFQIQVTRADGNQELDSLALAMPPGFVASLRGIPYCSEAQIAAAAAGLGKAEQANPSCPAASRVGSTNAGAGSGPRPFYAPGALYLAGPYKGAPLSVVAITPAVAGPFDLGNVVVRSALRLHPVTAQITAHTDPLPRILKGVPLRIRDLRINLDRPAWAQNPTSCEAMAVRVTAYGSHGGVSQPANRFQVGNCGALGFKPKTRIQLFGGVQRGKYQGVRAVVRPRPGDANISRTVVRFPKSAFVAQEHIRTVCTRVQFAAEACPKGSIYGRAIAYSPLLDYPLRGNVYLRSSDNDLPDAVADLRGPPHQPLKVEVAVRSDSVKGALRNTVVAAPDAPVSYFRLQMFGGRKGLIVNSRNICRGKNQARVAMKAHNGRRSLERVNIFNRKCKKLRQRR